jgi:membrane protein DedA with SNARE-associated domain/pimeloyl-ACP methyl ester carboxylesterase
MLVVLAAYLFLWISSTLLRPPGVSKPLILPLEMEARDVVFISGYGELHFKDASGENFQLMGRLSDQSAEHMSITESLSRSLGSSKTLVGTGIGASIAVEYATKYPDQIVELILYNPEGIEALDLMGTKLIDRPLRRVESALYRFFDRWVPFSWLIEESFGLWSWERAYRAHKTLDGIDFEKFPTELKDGVLVLGDTLESTWFRSLLKGSIDPASDYQSLLMELNSDSQGFDGLSVTGVVLIALSTLISEDLACIGSGILVSQEVITWFTALMGCLVGIYFGDMLIYLAGRFFGENLVRKRPLKWLISEEALERSERWFEHSGIWVLLACRFMPGTRVPIYFAAGVLKAKFWMVSAVLLGAAILWVPILVAVAYFAGEQIVQVFEQYESMAVWVLVAAIALIFFVSHQLLPLVTYRGRRLFYARLQRILRWEFWPAKLLYIPVVFYVLYLGIRYRSLSLCTNANPMAPLGGMLDESKSDILCALTKAKAPVSDYRIIPSEISFKEKRTIAFDSLEKWGSQFPIVLKPDVGERGKGVQILKNHADLEAALEGLEGKSILQRYVGGIEFGVLYERQPNEPEGKITSITSKRYTSIVGDGETDIEHLVLRDKRAVYYAHSFLDAFSERLYEVPAKGTEIRCVEIGTHSRGSLFLDADHLRTDRLEARFNQFCPNIDGYYLGRFDLKVPDETALKDGRDISLIELNLLTSEPTHMYDPKYSVFYAWKVLFRHWKVAFEIGDELRANGTPPPGTYSVLKVVFGHYFG